MAIEYRHEAVYGCIQCQMEAQYKTENMPIKTYQKYHFKNAFLKKARVSNNYTNPSRYVHLAYIYIWICV